MKEKPMLFSTPMVQAILWGEKTQTRRIVKNYGATSPFEVGDVIWVKETHYALGRWVKDGISPETGRQKFRFKDETPVGNYGYFDSVPEKVLLGMVGDYGWHKRSSLFMPKAAARIRLKVTGVNIEQLQEISELDAIAEGIEYIQEGAYAFGNWEYQGYRNYIDENSLETPIESYRSLFELINGEDSWDKNPYVWVIQFEKL